jgi:cytochrome c oxidase subunit 2
MELILLTLGGLLTVVLFGIIIRVMGLIGIAKKRTVAGQEEERVDGWNKINAYLFPAFFVLLFGAIFWGSGMADDYYLPEASSIHGKETDFLFWLTITIIFVAFILTHILLFFFPLIYRFKKKREAYFYPDNHKLEIIWTAIPAVVMAVLVGYGWVVWNDITSPAPEDAVQLEIMGKQFNWQVRYPGADGNLGRHDYRKIDGTNSMGIDFDDMAAFDDFTPREIRIPKGVPVQLNIRSRDVLHSVFMPHFRVKMDAVPGMPTMFHFVPTKTTAEMREELNDPKFDYELACTEICGTSHYAMRMVIVVQEPEEFAKWNAEQEPWIKSNADYAAKIGIDLENIALNN